MRRVPKDLLRAAKARMPLLAGMGMLTLLAACGQENRFIALPALHESVCEASRAGTPLPASMATCAVAVCCAELVALKDTR